MDRSTETLSPGLYRTSVAYPGSEEQIPAGALVYVGARASGERFVVRPSTNRMNQWYWSEPTTLLDFEDWLVTLKRLPNEGYYVLPMDLCDSAGSVLLAAHSIVQLGYSADGRALVFPGERHTGLYANALFFGAEGMSVDDDALYALQRVYSQTIHPWQEPLTT